MKLTAVTFTGVDHRTDAMFLEELSEEFPFVEWGVILPHSQRQKWVEAARSKGLLRSRLAGHICGEWAKQIFLGSFPTSLDVSPFRRVQLNIACFVSAEVPVDNPAVSHSPLPSTCEYIVQVGSALDAGIRQARELQSAGYLGSILFDRSGGRGVSPESWPLPAAGLPCGYAGGLGPDNLEFELGRLSQVAGDHEIWIDMQRNVRTDDGRALDLRKVRRCLEIAQPFCA